MKKLPGAMFLIDTTKESNAIKEARRLNIPTIAIVDTNCDPNKVDFPVPANDDATKSIAIIANFITAAIAEGLAERQAEKTDDSEDGEDVQDKGQRFSLEDEDKEKGEGGDRRGGGGKPGGAPKRRIAASGGGGRKPATKR
jgi:small subunit ribosomal protein S2